MSYDIDLCEPGTKTVIQFSEKHQIRGGTYALGGTDLAHLNITYNYWAHFQRVLGPNGIRNLYGKTAGETIPMLEEAISRLGDDVDPDYWASTEGNAKRALEGLLVFAKLRPDGVWDGD